jgi:hypothetical protein
MDDCLRCAEPDTRQSRPQRSLAGIVRQVWLLQRPKLTNDHGPWPRYPAFTIIAFLQNWNNFLFPLVVTSSEKLMMVSQGLTIFDGQISKVSYNLLMAGSLIAVVPVLAVALVVQRRVVEGLTLGAVR